MVLLLPLRYSTRTMPLSSSLLHPELDLMDPLDDLLDNSLELLSKPLLLPLLHEHESELPRNYRLVIDCAGYDPKLLKTELKDGKLVLSGKEETKDENGDFSLREFRRTFDLPAEKLELDSSKLVTSLAKNGKLVVELPFKREMQTLKNDESFLLADNKDGTKLLQLKLKLPDGLDPNRISVSCKDRELVITSTLENNEESKDKQSFHKELQMPNNADSKLLKCLYSDGFLTLEAPLLENVRQIPVDFKRSNEELHEQLELPKKQKPNPLMGLSKRNQKLSLKERRKALNRVVRSLGLNHKYPVVYRLHL